MLQNISSLRSAWFILAVLPVTACLTERRGGIELEPDITSDEPSTGGSLADAPAAEPLNPDASFGTDTDAGTWPSTDASIPGATNDEDDQEENETTADESSNGSTNDPTQGTPTEPSSGQPPDAGVGSPDGITEWAPSETCVYHTPAIPFSEQALGDAGTDAGPPPGPHVTLYKSEYLGAYLADHLGYTLYIYTADLPGNCNTPPVSTCFDDCLIAWPIFEAYDRVLAEGLDDGAFGTFIREDGLPQTTYYGWPLYYYKKDLAPEDIVGQGKGKVWYVAEQILPNLVIMRASEEREGVKYLGDGEGFTLYTHVNDTLGTETQMPRSACVGACANDFPPFSVRSLRAVTDLEPDELSVFVRQDGVGQQVSYRGQPLYRHRGDTKSGDMNGLLVEGFELALP